MQEFLKISKIIPVITLYNADTSIDLANALIEGGIRILEITLRTKAGLEGIRRIANEVPNAVVGAGTVTNERELEAVKKAGAKFAISPGLTPSLAKESKNLDIPLIPGVSTPSELMLALEFGFSNLKFFPAESSGGVAMLKSLAPVFSEVRFCPTGGISLNNIKSYLALENVLCVGGSWLTPKDILENKQWGEITKIAKESLEYIN